MSTPRVLVLVLAGGAGSRLELLTERRAKPAVPFGASYRLVDFALSSCAHSGVTDVWVVQQNNPGPLSRHLSNGRPWDLDRTRGGLMVIHPHEGDHREGFHTGTADALWRTAPSLREADPEVVVVVSADAVYRLDYLDVALAHRDSGALVTAVTTVHDGDCSRYGVVLTEDGWVTDYAYKPEQPRSDVVTTEVFAVTPGPVLDLLDELAEEHDDLGDLGDHLLPRLVADRALREHRFTGYWQDVGTVPAYWQAHMDLLGPDPAFDLDDETWPLLTLPGRHAPARVSARAQVVDSLLGPGSKVRGDVRRSVVSTGVVVEAGATVRDSVLLPGVVVRAGAVVERAVLDSEAVVGRDARVGAPETDGDGAEGDETDGDGADGITLVGRGVTVPDGGRVEAGARLDHEDGDGDT